MSWFRRKKPAEGSSTEPTAGSTRRFDPLDVVRGYHQRTKHHPMRYAAALGYFDWETQPDPFRRFVGAPLLELPLEAQEAAAYRDLYVSGALPSLPLGPEALGQFLLHALALSAWKRIPEARWSLRVNPSSGNLHPTEGWLLLPASAGLAVVGESPQAALWHYAPKEHGLERRATFEAASLEPASSEQLSSEPASIQTAAAEALFAGLPKGAFFVALSSIPWREAWKYGERAYRYTQLDVGHGLGALRLAAALCGWRLTALPELCDETLAGLLGLEREDASHGGEGEVPDLLALVWPAGQPEPQVNVVELEGRLRQLAKQARFVGQANRLSSGHQDWEVLNVVERTCRRLGSVPRASQPDPWPGFARWSQAAAVEVEPQTGASAPHSTVAVAGGVTSELEKIAPNPAEAAQANHQPVALGAVPQLSAAMAQSLSASRVIRGRRSALAFDRRSTLARADFEHMLRRLLPTPVGKAPQAERVTPWEALPGEPRVHVVCFVHRVDGLTPGLYLLPRSAAGLQALRACLRPEFKFVAPPGTDPNLPLLLLAEGRVDALAARLCCEQAIAAEGCFAVALLADLEGALAADGPPAYRQVHVEAGLVGHVLYLEAEALGQRGTGIGCFFDDPTHSALGLADGRFQSLYHFTMGQPVEDQRLSVEPAYAARGASASEESSTGG